MGERKGENEEGTRGRDPIDNFKQWQQQKSARQLTERGMLRHIQPIGIICGRTVYLQIKSCSENVLTKSHLWTGKYMLFMVNVSVTIFQLYTVRCNPSVSVTLTQCFFISFTQTFTWNFLHKSYWKDLFYILLHTCSYLFVFFLFFL